MNTLFNRGTKLASIQGGSEIMKKGMTLTATIALMGCASSGVVQTGPNAYTLAKSEWGFTSGAVHAARLTQEAADFCNAKGTQISVVSKSSNDVQLGKTPAAEVNFQCIEK